MYGVLLGRVTLMVLTVTKLIIRVEQLEWDLAEVKEELVKLQASAMKSMTPEDRVVARSARGAGAK